MKSRNILNKKRARRTFRTRAKVFGTAKKPRLAIFRSNKHVVGQLIDDAVGHTIIHASSDGFKSGKKIERARKTGELLAEKAKKAGVTSAVSDRRHYKYHGRVKALVEGARSGGLKI